MSQEKKNIRVLTPTKKNKKISPLVSGIIGVAIGISATSLAFYTYLNQPSFQPINAADTDSTHSNDNLSNIDSGVTQADQNEQSEPDEYHQAQPKLNELNNIFKHQQTNSAQATQPVTSSKNPFESTFNQAQPLSNKTPQVPPKAEPVKKTTTEALPKTIKKPESKPTTANANKVAESKADTDENIDIPVASVEVSVTRTAKEPAP